jgi:hypothetical protein
MKKYFFLLLGILPLAVTAQKKADTVKLKNGQTIAGYIYKMDGGKIFVARQNDSVAYTADEVQGIMFCHEVRGKGTSSGSSSSSSPCNDKAVGGNKNFSKSKSSNSYSGNPCDDKKEEKGTLVFRCNMCGGEGNLKIISGNDESKTIDNYKFTLKKSETLFTHTAYLIPGEYKWTYTDTNKNSANGKFIIRKSEEKKIVLFENE